MKILIIEDDKSMLSFLKNNLKHSGFSINASSNGQDGLNLALTNSHDLIILDLNLPDISGFEVCQKVRQAKLMTPILILSGEDKTSSKTLLLDSGADDYLTKPFCFTELIARINALLRRPAHISDNIIKIADLELDIKKQKVKRNNQEISLTRTEYLILELLLSKRGSIISRGEILEKVWDHEADIFSKAIETHILNIRNKIDKNKKIKIIETITGRGYKIS
jgi:two-component system copper resistance phosphate regulon response regulator CusR